jgi:hypothetical protein
LERFSYQSQNTDVKESFVTSQTLVSIQTPTIQNSEGLWEVDRNHRFFLDDIYYGNCIAKWMAEQLNIEVPTIDAIIRWSQEIRNERIIDDNNRLILDSKDLSAPLKAGIPCYYGYKTIEETVTLTSDMTIDVVMEPLITKKTISVKVTNGGGILVINGVETEISKSNTYTIPIVVGTNVVFEIKFNDGSNVFHLEASTNTDCLPEIQYSWDNYYSEFTMPNEDISCNVSFMMAP